MKVWELFILVVGKIIGSFFLKNDSTLSIKSFKNIHTLRSSKFTSKNISSGDNWKLRHMSAKCLLFIVIFMTARRMKRKEETKRGRKKNLENNPVFSKQGMITKILTLSYYGLFCSQTDNFTYL